MTATAPRRDALESSRMTLIEHLGELRRRLVYVFVVLLVMTFVCFAFSAQLFEILRQPLYELTNQKLVVLSPLEMFFTYMKLAILAAVFVSTPWILAQVWLFVAPGLYAHEKRWIAPFIVLGTLFFVAGGAFGFYVVIPTMFEYLTQLVPPTVENTYSVELYFSLVIRLLLAFGLVFELPLLMWILAAAGIVDPATFARLRKYWVVAAFVLGALLSDPSPVTQLLMAVPLIVFWELGILGGKLLRRKRDKARAATTTAPVQT